MSIFKNIKFFKNIFITTGFTFIFGMYSVFHLYFYIKDIDAKMDNLTKKELDRKQLYFEELKVQIFEMNNSVSLLTKRINELESKNNLIEYLSISETAISETAISETVISETAISEIDHTEETKEYTCINKDDLFEKDSDEESIKSGTRSRSASISWVKKQLFG
jgi:hypothetical protein